MRGVKSWNLFSSKFYYTWHSSLTKGNEKDLERVQKAAIKQTRNMIHKEKPRNSRHIKSKEKREKLCTKFAQKCLLTKKTFKMFEINTKEHIMKVRKMNKYQTTKTKTNRFKSSATP